MKEFIKNHRFVLICLLTLWVKTFIVSTFIFQVSTADMLETVIFILNPLSFILILFSFGLLMKPGVQRWYLFICTLLLSIVLYSNAVYFREFTDIITLPMLVMGGNAGDLSTSVFELIQWYDVLFFLDILVFAVLLWKKPALLTVTQLPLRKNKKVYGGLIGAALVVIGLSQLDQPENPETMTHTFDREGLIQRYGLYNFYVYDAVIHTRTAAQAIFSEEDEWNDINEHRAAYRALPNSEMHGIARDKNVVVISLESIESFVIGETAGGEEITPYLNELIEESYYFPNFYDQTGQGKTSDAEFMINNSLYPVGRGAVFHTHSENEYTSLPNTLRRAGYETVSFHANDRTFYNRDVMYENLGYDYYYSGSYFDITEENSVGWGLKDIDFFRQSMDYVEELSEPFYATFLTLTNHFPYELDEEDHFIDPLDSESEILSRYIPTVRYTDEAVRLFMEDMKEAGLYEDTVFVMYGDHYGIAESHNDAMGEFLGKDIDPYENVQLARVPLIIHIPGQEGEEVETISGKVDVMPTLLNLLGIPEHPRVMFGSDLFAQFRENFVVLRNGDIVTDEYMYTANTCYERGSKQIVHEEACSPIRDRGEWELFYSDSIIFGDLIRFRDVDDM
ncbi:LTA synthase family protein [Alteribacter natronophilus]|uniref:LTA synthase family protein n=1 Tax=Alteribacter natronophilus TaxID=2583810 RepID=UPI00110E01B7|nr:LTA synthase family protein [Alteribacter natronophilus]TMW72094.1 LTA synthase family protein [Alteribacter natronophilus]